MKNRLNITIENSLMEQAKQYAARHKTSVSQLVEHYFKSLNRPLRKKNILQLLDELPAPKIDTGQNLKKDYYEDQSKKYGF